MSDLPGSKGIELPDISIINENSKKKVKQEKKYKVITVKLIQILEENSLLKIALIESL